MYTTYNSNHHNIYQHLFLIIVLKLCIFRQLRGVILMIFFHEVVNLQVVVLFCSTGSKDFDVMEKGQGHVMSQAMYVASCGSVVEW